MSTRILELCLSPDIGGLELYMFRATKALSLNDEVTPVVGPDSLLGNRFRSESMHTIELSRKFRALPLLAAYRLAKIVDNGSFDVIHVHWTRDIPLAVLAKKLSNKKPMIVSTRHMQITRPKKDYYHDFLYSGIDMNIAVTYALAQEMKKFMNTAYADRIEVIHSGVSAPESMIIDSEKIKLRHELGVPDECFLVGLIGRIKYAKGQHLLVDAVGSAINGGKNIAALIVGHSMESGYLNALKEKVNKNKWHKRIKFINFVENPQKLMQLCDVVVLTSGEETFGLVLVEAMRAGVAVIGSDRGGVLEIIDDNETGLLFRSGDSADLHVKLMTLMANTELRDRLAAAGKVKADRLFNEKIQFSRLRESIQRRLESRR